MRLLPAFRGQPVAQFWVPADPIKLTTTVTTGVIANTTAINYSLISSFTTRFAGWDEYRVIQVRIEWKCFSSTNPGMVRGWVEDRSNATPTLAIAEASEGLCFSAGDVVTPHVLTYRIMDPVYIDYTQLNATQTIGYINTYTNNANYGATGVATDYVGVHAKLLFQFRGLA